MKLVTYDAGDRPRHGVLLEAEGAAGPRVLDVQAALLALAAERGQASDPAQVAARYGGDMLGLIERADEALPALRRILTEKEYGSLRERASVPLAQVRLLSPIPRPVSLRDGYAFRQHVETARRNRGLPMIPEFDHFPIFYYSNHLSVIGPGTVSVRKKHLERLDFELEAAVVLGRGGRDMGVEEADRAIFGLMVMNDWSARAVQMEEMKLNLGPAKGKDFATAIGPYLVPKEDLADHLRQTDRGVHFDLRMSAEVNGTQVSEGNLGDMAWTFAEIISRASYGVTLHPGEVIGSGTVGTGCFLELNGSKVYDNWWLLPGDRVVCEVEGLGRLENVVVLDEQADRKEAP